MTERLANDAESTLTAAIDADDLTLTVTSAATFPNAGNFRVRVNDELMLVTGVAGSTFTVTRGIESTTAAAHDTGDEIVHVLTAASLSQWLSENIPAAEVTQAELDTAVDALEAADTAEASTRAAADTALDTRVDALETAPPAHTHDDRYYTETEVDTALAAKAAAADLTAHVNDTTDAHDASAVSFSPTGTIAATDVQAALAEVATEAASSGAGTVLGHVITVAAVDSRTTTGADYVCDGTADQVQIQAALDELAAGGEPGVVQLYDGTYTFNGEVVVGDEHSGCAIIGAGAERTTINGDPGAGVSYFELSQPSGETLDGFTICNLFIDGTGWTLGATDAYGNGTITDTGLGVCKNILISGVKIRTSNRSCSGIVAHNDTVTGFAPVINEHWRIIDCDIVCAGDFVYGIKIQKRTEWVWIEHNFVEVTKQGQTSVTIGANNCIALYGGSRYFRIAGNIVRCNANHSPIAVSPARVGTIVSNTVIVLNGSLLANEAGIEVEYKADHSDNTTPTEDVVVSGNTILGAYWGIYVGNREGTTNVATQGPKGVIVTGNAISSSVSRGIKSDAGTDFGLGFNTFRDSLGASRLDIASAVTLNLESLLASLTSRGSIIVEDSAGTDQITLANNGRITALENIHLASTSTRLVRNSSTGGIGLEASNSAASVDLKVGGTNIALFLANEIRLQQLLKWNVSGNEQTTVGAAGAASALPATPTKYLKVKDSAGTTLVIPAYAAS